VFSGQLDANEGYRAPDSVDLLELLREDREFRAGNNTRKRKPVGNGGTEERGGPVAVVVAVFRKFREGRGCGVVRPEIAGVKRGL
jgi:hypothetical protein